ncbi:Putative peptidoglycan binding domain-containing protein [Nocardioides sp. YR527]|uniref:peptidoglycan-binding domain-containing protein n=1 Tax=Nocardioides sp. YR527 TaxID=1881028 RepID=UPI0008822910|nr:peptidoglycan-binding domain-containing protein [Nocardioides sp. YR527]SDK73129.1 Putative peptidoglycan binding domain-containing protein [Nocardioides sp. YR527]
MLRSFNKKLTFALAGLAAVGASLVVTSSPASAAGVCNGSASGWVYNNYNYRMAMVYDSNSTYSPLCYLNPGHTGNAVKTLQRALNQCYGRSLDVDGIYGDDTKAAVKVAQGRLGLKQDGLFGPNTSKAMSWPWNDDIRYRGCATRTAANFQWVWV